MIPAFYDSKLWEEFKTSLLSWEGTPYRHLQLTKGRGVDCTLLIANPLLEANILTKVEMPKYYSKDWYVDENNVIEEILSKNFNENCYQGFQWKKEKGVGEILGDIELFCFHKNGVLHHSGVLMEENKLFHCTPKRAATKVDFNEKFRKFCKAHYRLWRIE